MNMKNGCEKNEEDEKNEKEEKVIFLEAESDEARQKRKQETRKKHAVALLILKALNDYLERSPESRLDLPPVFNERGESMCPGNMDIFYAPLSFETEAPREAAFIYAR